MRCPELARSPHELSTLDGRPVHFQFKTKFSKEELIWTELAERGEIGRLQKPNIVAVVPTTCIVQGQHCYNIISIAAGPPTQDSLVDYPFKYQIREHLVTGLPRGFLLHNTTHILPPHLKVLWTRPETSALHVVVSLREECNRAMKFWLLVVRPALDAMGFPEGTYKMHEVASSSKLEELTKDVILASAEAGTSQTILLLADDNAFKDIIRLLPTGQERKCGYVPPSIGILALGKENAFAKSLLMGAASRSLGLNGFLRGVPQALPVLRVTLFGDWGWWDGHSLIALSANERTHSCATISIDSRNSCASRALETKIRSCISHARGLRINTGDETMNTCRQGQMKTLVSAAVPILTSNPQLYLSEGRAFQFSLEAFPVDSLLSIYTDQTFEKNKPLAASTKISKSVEKAIVVWPSTTYSHIGRNIEINIDGRILCPCRGLGLDNSNSITIERVPRGEESLNIVTQQGVDPCPIDLDELDWSL